MQSVFSAILFFLISLPVISAAQETSAIGAPVIEPLSTTYLVVLGVISVVVVGGFCWYYMRWDSEKDKPDQK
jgi:hypothetical protein